MKVKLKPQRKNPERTSIYINDKYAFSVDKETLSLLGLYDKQEISQKELDKLIYQVEKQKAKNYAYRLLTYRMRTEKELVTRLRSKNFADNIINDVINDLKKLKLVDDNKFALSFATDRLQLALKGKRLIFAELIKKGIADTDAKSILNQINHTQEQSACQRLIEKYQHRYRKLSPLEKKQRLYGLLVRRGFSYPIIKSVLNISDLL